MNVDFCQQVFEKLPNIKFYKILGIWSRVVPSGTTDMWTDVTMLTVPFTILRTRLEMV